MRITRTHKEQIGENRFRYTVTFDVDGVLLEESVESDGDEGEYELVQGLERQVQLSYAPAESPAAGAESATAAAPLSAPLGPIAAESEPAPASSRPSGKIQRALAAAATAGGAIGIYEAVRHLVR